MTHLIIKRYWRTCVALATCCVIVSLVSCRSSNVMLDTGWDNEGSTYLTSYRPEDSYPPRETRIQFELSIEHDICSVVNSCGVPVPDRIAFYPDGTGGALAPFDIDLASYEPGAYADTRFAFEYDYGDRDEHFAVAEVHHGGEVSLVSDTVSASYLRLFDRGPVDTETPEQPRRAFEVLVDPHICTGTNEQGAPVPDSIVFYPDRWKGYDLDSVGVQVDSVEVDLSTGEQVANDWSSFTLEYTFPKNGQWRVVVKTFYGGETKEYHSYVDS